MNLQQLKQNNMQKESGMVDNPEELKPLSKDDLRKIMPNKSEEKDSPKQLINDELSGIDALMESEMKEANVKMEEEVEKNKETLDDAIFDAPVEDIDAGLLTPEESEKALSLQCVCLQRLCCGRCQFALWMCVRLARKVQQ